MADAARQFEGEHDFTSFAASSGSEEDDRDRNMVRVLYSSHIIREPDRDEISAYVASCGQSFLRYMVRKIVGTLIEVVKSDGSRRAISPKCSICGIVRVPGRPYHRKGYIW